MKFADRLIGKGLSTMVIIQLVTYNLAWMLVLVIPMAVLISTLMAFGNLSQNNEIAVLKASGMSLYKMMFPPLLGSIIVALFLVWFNNNIYPDANHAARVLAYDISRKKPTLSLVPGVFSQEIPGKSILARSIDQKTNELKDLTIYDKSDPKSINIVTAKRGKLYFVKNQTKLVLDLFDGEIHTSNVFDNKDYRKILFSRHKIVMDADEFSFSQSSAESMRRGDRELGAPAMRILVDSLEIIRKRYQTELEEKIDNNFLPKLEIKNLKPEQTQQQIAKLNVSEAKINRFTRSKKYIYLRVGDKIKAAKGSLRSSTRRLQYNKERIDNYWVEIHKKYSIPFACILFILVGAPLGTMTRKGGFGVASGISLIFFLMYWAFLIGGEKLSDRALLSPFWGTWSANVALLFIGAYLTYKSAKERVTINFSFLQKLIPKSLRTKKEEDEDN
ncbi:Lipopolysaccharide export system permease protein LptF [hydrothermal vent metagenome]|uniref:Lipopolysaccharide export system permease protein LptF n=1 Tax=hydrothermal vent metagenome TaxID=652676 RepID=A0A3B1BLB6_9ZZZZ